MSIRQADVERFRQAVAAALHEHWVLYLIEGIIKNSGLLQHSIPRGHDIYRQKSRHKGMVLHLRLLPELLPNSVARHGTLKDNIGSRR